MVIVIENLFLLKICTSEGMGDVLYLILYLLIKRSTASTQGGYNESLFSHRLQLCCNFNLSCLLKQNYAIVITI